MRKEAGEEIDIGPKPSHCGLVQKAFFVIWWSKAAEHGVSFAELDAARR